MSDPEGRPDAVDAARAMFFTFLAIGAMWGIAALAGGAPREVLSLAMQAAFFAGPLLYARAVKLRPFKSSGYATLGPTQIALILVASLGSMWLLQGLTLVQEPVLDWLGLRKVVTGEKNQLTQNLKEAQEKGFAWEALLLVVASPVCEETFFRGLALRGFARRLGALPALILTSFFFAAMHQTLVQFALMFVLGFYFGTLIWLTRSLWAGMIAHALNNSAVVILTAKFGPKIEALRAPWWMYALSAIVFVGAIAILALERRKRAPISP
jgi:membrane protease YdiL (CAAX protease family)